MPGSGPTPLPDNPNFTSVTTTGGAALASNGMVTTGNGYYTAPNNTNIRLFSQGLTNVVLSPNSTDIFSCRTFPSNGVDLTGNLAATSDVEITDATKGVILKSPNGTRFRLTVSNAGVVTAAAA